MELSHIFSPDTYSVTYSIRIQFSLTNTLFSQDRILERAPDIGTVGRPFIRRIGERVRNLQLAGSNLWVHTQCPPPATPHEEALALYTIHAQRELLPVQNHINQGNASCPLVRH